MWWVFDAGLVLVGMAISGFIANKYPTFFNKAVVVVDAVDAKVKAAVANTTITK